jgi:hypothetical protein
MALGSRTKLFALGASCFERRAARRQVQGAGLQADLYKVHD